MEAATRVFVRCRAEQRCEYCGLRQEHSELAHHVEHVIAKQHGGSDDADNLALACHRCNLRKGPNLTGIDPETGQLVRLFHPRQDRWSEHFAWQGAYLVGKTPVGRVTIQVLAINAQDQQIVREQLLQEGWHQED